MLSLCFGLIAGAWYIHANSGVPMGELKINPPIDSITIYTQQITLSLPETLPGKLTLLTDTTGNPPNNVILRFYPDSEVKANSNASDFPTEAIAPNLDTVVYILHPEMISPSECKFTLPGNLCLGNYELVVPEGYFEIDPDYVETDEINFSEADLEDLSIVGAWHKPGSEWHHPGMFSFHDDDGVDGMIPSSVPDDYQHGYFSILYPMLESLGVRGCVSLEGRRAGFTAIPPKPSDNTLIARRLQDERGWEIMSHSMRCLGERLNNWVVDSVNSPLAQQILLQAVNKGPTNDGTTSIYSRETKKQYVSNEDSSEWLEVENPNLIRPFAGDYESKKVVLYNEDYNVKYHWKEWFDIAEEFGIEGKTWVMHNAQCSYKNIPAIVKECPRGFVDQSNILYNTPPMATAAGRMLCEGQFFSGNPDMYSYDNSFNYAQYEWFRSKIDEAHEKGAWIIMGGHAYRYVWDNYLPGALVSEGGSYPDEWVKPMDGIDPLSDFLTPPDRLGISSWSEWYPCPGTRLHMMWELLKYAKSLGMINVTSNEGFEIMGNKKNVGYFNYGQKIGYDDNDVFEGSRKRQPHYVVGANDEVYYYNRGVNRRISAPYFATRYITSSSDTNEEDNTLPSSLNSDPDIEQENLFTPNGDTNNLPCISSDEAPCIRAFSIDGRVLDIKSLSRLSPGIWIVNGKKITIK